MKTYNNIGNSFHEKIFLRDSFSLFNAYKEFLKRDACELINRHINFSCFSLFFLLLDQTGFAKEIQLGRKFLRGTHKEMKNGTAVVVANKPLTEFDDHHILMNECEK